MGRLYDYDFNIPDDDYLFSLTDGTEIGTKEQEQIAKNLRSNSIGSNKRTSHKGKSKKTGNRNKAKAAICALIATATIGLGVKGTLVAIEKASFQIDAKAATKIVAAEEQAKFLDNELGFLSENGEYIIKDNTVEEYKEKLGDITPKELYAIKEIVNEKELKDIVEALGYNSIEEYYKAHGYVDKDTNVPSEEVFNNYVEAEIVPLYRNGTLLVNENGKGLN